MLGQLRTSRGIDGEVDHKQQELLKKVFGASRKCGFSEGQTKKERKKKEKLLVLMFFDERKEGMDLGSPC